MIMSILVYFRACPLTSILSPERGEEVWADARFGEAMIMSILVYFRACPLTSILSPEGERKFWGGRAIRRGNNEEHSAWLTGACPLTSILSPEGERKFGRTRDSERQ